MAKLTILALALCLLLAGGGQAWCAHDPWDTGPLNTGSRDSRPVGRSPQDAEGLGQPRSSIPPPCPPGQTWSASERRCTSEQAPAASPCPPGQQWSQVLGRCQDVQPGPGQPNSLFPCPPGYYRDQGRCRPSVGDDDGGDTGPKAAAPGEAAPEPDYNAVPCPGGTMWDLRTRRCQPLGGIGAMRPPEGCPPGTHWDSAARACRSLGDRPCPPGQSYDPGTGSCQPVGTPLATPPPGGCPAGHQWSTLWGRCLVKPPTPGARPGSLPQSP